MTQNLETFDVVHYILAIMFCYCCLTSRLLLYVSSSFFSWRVLAFLLSAVLLVSKGIQIGILMQFTIQINSLHLA